MTNPRAALLGLGLALFSLACTPPSTDAGATKAQTKDSPPATKDSGTDPANLVEVSGKAPPPGPGEPEPPAPPPALELGPAADASDEIRAKQVLALLSDGHTASQLPVMASDPDVPFNPRLVDELRPPAMPRIPMVSHVRPEVEGPLDRDVVHRVVRTQSPQLNMCYATEWATNNELQGRATLEFEITGEGKVRSPSIRESTLANEGVETCVVEQAEAWEFPSAKGDTRVSYPLRFDTR